MYLIGEHSGYINDLITTLQNIPARMLEGLDPVHEQECQLSEFSDLFSVIDSDKLLLITQGTVHAKVDQRELFYLQEGDLLGMRQGLKLPSTIYSSKQSVDFLIYDRASVFNHIHQDSHRQQLFTQYVLGQASLMAELLAQQNPHALPTSTGFMQVSQGEEIIRANSPAENVYILMEGHAEAYMEDIKVGDIYKDEVFGGLALFTEDRHSASVRATQDSSIMTVPKEQFLNLMQSQPQIGISLMKNMSRIIHQLNARVIELSQSKAVTATEPAPAG